MSIWKPHVEVVGRPTASPESQVKYLIRVVQIKQDEIETLKKQIETVRLERKLDEMKFDRELEALGQARERLMCTKRPPLETSKWRLFGWFRKKK